MDELIVQHSFQLCVLLSKPKAVVQVKPGLSRSWAIRYQLISSSMSMVPEQKLLFVYYQRYISSVEKCVRAMFLNRLEVFKQIPAVLKAHYNTQKWDSAGSGHTQ